MATIGYEENPENTIARTIDEIVEKQFPVGNLEDKYTKCFPNLPLIDRIVSREELEGKYEDLLDYGQGHDKREDNIHEITVRNISKRIYVNDRVCSNGLRVSKDVKVISDETDLFNTLSIHYTSGKVDNISIEMFDAGHWPITDIRKTILFSDEQKEYYEEESQLLEEFDEQNPEHVVAKEYADELYQISVSKGFITK